MKEVALGTSGKAMQLEAQYNFINNLSNDLYYDYRVGVVSVGVEMAF